MTTVVILPGGFHPYHAGHYALYQSACRAFPDAEVYVAATNDTSERPFPFAIKEKLATLAGVEPGHFVQVKSPFRAEEITSQFNPEKDQLIFVRSTKDAKQPPIPGGVKKDGKPSYLQPLLGAKKLEPFAKHAYMAYLPTVEFGGGMTSATEIRAEWPTLDDQGKLDRVMSLYPKTQSNPKLAATVVKMLDTAIGGPVSETYDQLGVAEVSLDPQYKSTSSLNVSPELRGISIPGNMKHPGWKEPAWSFQEIAEKLGITTQELQGFIAYLGNFPKKVEGIKSKFGSKAYYPRSEVKRWVNATNVRDIIKSKQGVVEGSMNEAAPWVDKLGLGNFFRKIQNVDANSQKEIRILSGVNHSMQLYFKTILALNAQVGPAASLFWPLLGKQALLFAGGALAYTFGKIVASKIGRAVFGTSEEALAWAQAHLQAGKERKTSFEFDGKTYPVTVIDPDSIAKLESQIAELRAVIGQKQSRAAKAEYDKSVKQRRQMQSQVAKGVDESHTVGYIQEKEKGSSANIDADPELRQAKIWAKQHYGQFEVDPEVAFDKWVQRGLRHSQENDIKHDKLINFLTDKIIRLERELKRTTPAATNEDYVEEQWSEKYKRSIDCSHPKGFSQRAHCAGRKK